MTIQSQQLDSGQKTMPGLLPGAFGDQWRELGLFYFHKFHIQNYHCSIQHNQSFVCVWCGGEAEPCFKSSLSVTALDLVTTLFSQLCALFQSRSLFHVMTQLRLKEKGVI